MEPTTKPPQVRNRAYEETHRAMITTAVRLISEKGIDALSIAGVARDMGIDRTTVYYHFNSRKELLEAVSGWANEKLARGMDVSISEQDRAEQITRFVLEQPALIKLWIDGFISGSDIRDSYTRWDDLVEGTKAHFAREFPAENIDAEVYCVMMLCALVIGPRVFANGVQPDAPLEAIMARFLKEGERMFQRYHLPIAPRDGRE